MGQRFKPVYSLCDWPWSAYQQRDCQEQGPPELRVVAPRSLLLGLHIRDPVGHSLGILGIRCTHGGSPMTMQIADGGKLPIDTEDGA